MQKLIIAAAISVFIAACSGQPLHRDVLRQHAERNYRVAATVNKTYAVDSLGVGLDNVGYQVCMRRAGFAVVAR
jgi:hypothetical protein